MQDIINSEEYQRLLERANYDDLTRVLNRRAGRECLEDLIDKAQQMKKLMVIALCDVNELKQVNDQYGHKEGDRMLCNVSSAMARDLEKDDIVFRLSGDEFVIALYDVNKEQGYYRIEKVLEYLKREKDVLYETSFSYGLVEVYPEERRTISDLIEKADSRMYMQKRDYHIMRAEQKAMQSKSISPDQFVYDKEHLYDALLAATDDYIFVGNMKTGIFRFPPAMVEEFGLPGEVLENAAAFWSDKIHPSDRAEFLESNQEIADGRADYQNIEYRAKNVGGVWMWLRCRGSMVRDKMGLPELFAGVITNLEKCTPWVS